MVRGAEHHRRQCAIRLKSAGRTRETPCSTCDLIRLGKVAHPMVEIDAQNSLRHRDGQETSVFEAKDARAGDNPNTWGH
jgi:hypothetical protein